MHTLVIESDGVAAQRVAALFTTPNLRPLVVGTGEAAVTLAKRKQPSLIVLGLPLPDMVTDSVLGKIRAHCSSPIMVITDHTDEEQRVNFTARILRSGADEVLTRSAAPEEFLARALALLRRDRTQWPKEPEYARKGLEHWVGSETRIFGKKVILTPAHHEIMDILVKFRGRPLNDKRYRELTRRDFFPSALLGVQVCKLRQVLRGASGGEDYVRNLWGSGYYLPQS